MEKLTQAKAWAMFSSPFGAGISLVSADFSLHGRCRRVLYFNDHCCNYPP